jgi:hypothetical protein
MVHFQFPAGGDCSGGRDCCHCLKLVRVVFRAYHVWIFAFSALSLTTLSFIFSRNLSENQLTGPIPENISSLAALNLLDLHGNNLGGIILPDLERLTNLTSLNLSSNNFVGVIPDEIGQIFNLDTLWAISP